MAKAEPIFIDEDDHKMFDAVGVLMAPAQWSTRGGFSTSESSERDQPYSSDLEPLEGRETRKPKIKTRPPSTNACIELRFSSVIYNSKYG